MSHNTFPRGWFVVAWSEDLGEGDVKPLRYFAKDFVLFRLDGRAVVLDAYCPHLGAHLGHGGRIEDGGLRCPFHAWTFGVDGTCKSIPYAGKMPRNTSVTAHHVRELNGAIHLWHDPDGAAPAWEIPVIDEYGTDAWSAWNTNCLSGVKTHPREIVENVADSAHFPTVHRTEVSRFENEYVDHMATQRTTGVARPPQGGVDHFSIEATYYGPAFQISHMAGYLDSILLMAHTPIDETHLDLRFAVSLKKSGPKTEQFAQFYAENLRLGFHEDISIWEHKVFRDRPALCDGDGPIGRLRTWYRQFYEVK